jgi:hypothetical protein
MASPGIPSPLPIAPIFQPGKDLIMGMAFIGSSRGTVSLIQPEFQIAPLSCKDNAILDRD